MTYETREIVRQCAGMVATELGDGWTVDTSPAFAEYPGAYLDGPNGARLYIRADWRNADRLEIGTIYPDGARDVYPSAEYRKIGAGRGRGPAVIAREITRRLLPEYLPELERVTAGIAKNGRAAESREAFARQLVDILPGGRMPHPTSPDVVNASPAGRGGGTTYLDIRLSHDGSAASFDRSGLLPAALVLELAAVMAEYTRRTGAES